MADVTQALADINWYAGRLPEAVATVAAELRSLSAAVEDQKAITAKIAAEKDAVIAQLHTEVQTTNNIAAQAKLELADSRARVIELEPQVSGLERQVAALQAKLLAYPSHPDVVAARRRQLETQQANIAAELKVMSGGQ